MENQDPPPDMGVDDVGRNDDNGGQHVIAAAAAADREVNAIAIDDDIVADVIGRVDNEVEMDVNNHDRQQEAGRLNDEDGGVDEENGEEIQEENVVEGGEVGNQQRPPPPPPQQQQQDFTNTLLDIGDIEYDGIIFALRDERIRRLKDQFDMSTVVSFMESMIRLRVATPLNVVDEFLSKVYSMNFRISYPAIVDAFSVAAHTHPIYPSPSLWN